MAQLPGRRASHLAALSLLGLGLCVATAAAEPPSLLGSWHVLVHYRDASAEDPERWRWEDRLWVFEAAGPRLRWREYPIVVFPDASGRFAEAGGRSQRVAQTWEPSAGQLEQIRDGLEVNPRGQRSKTLRGSTQQGWRSTAVAAAGSAAVVTYSEQWSIRGAPERPVFEQRDVLGSASVESLDGVTRYATTGVSEDGALLTGRFERDASLRGRFFMRRSGELRDVRERRESGDAGRLP